MKGRISILQDGNDPFSSNDVVPKHQYSNMKRKQVAAIAVTSWLYAHKRTSAIQLARLYIRGI